MLAFTIEYLTGRVVATRFNNFDAPEWPPHPARFFSALVAALHQGDADPVGAEALRWLAQQPPPALCASEADERSPFAAFVPVNDSNEPGKRDTLFPVLAETCPLRRGRQQRTFPSVTPRRPVAHLIWEEADVPPSVLLSLRALAGKLTYLGHSSSLVHVRVCQDPPPPTLVPSGDGSMLLRVPRPGQLEALERAYALYARTGIRGPLPCAFQGYRRVEDSLPSPGAPLTSVLGEMVVFRRRQGPLLSLRATGIVITAFRGAALAACEEPIPEVLSGHQPNGTPSQRPHVALVPLPDVGHRYADGHLLGVAAVLPRNLSAEVRRAVLRAPGGSNGSPWGRRESGRLSG